MASAFVFFFPDFSLITTFCLQLTFLFLLVFVCAVQLLFETRYNFNLNRVFFLVFFFFGNEIPQNTTTSDKENRIACVCNVVR